MSKWRKRPVVVDAVQIPRKADSDMELIPLLALIAQASDERRVEVRLHSRGLVEVVVESLEGTIKGVHPCWFVVGTLGEPYTVDNAVFADVYEPWSPEADAE